MQSKSEVSKDYDRIFSTHGLRADDSYYKWIIRILGGMSNKKFLDISCGEGIVLREAGRLGAKTFGLDISQQALKKTKINSPASFLVLSDGENICFNAKFDYVTCLGSLEHYNYPEAGCREIARLLEDSGRSIIVLPNKFSMHVILDVLFKGKSGNEGFQIIERDASFGQWKEFLEANGLKALKAYKVNERPVLWKDGKIRSIAKFLRNLWFYYLVPFYFAREFAFLCEKKEKALKK
ncbi:MAG: class I SAM-dependent methyltransferase [Candidatus Omnitrophota bacterium]|nr:class I SAM-dependent methyltransferase [Candidatus Omnitrophota bacterium]